MSPTPDRSFIMPPSEPDPVWGLLGRPSDAVLASRELSAQWKQLCARAEQVWRAKRGPVRLKRWQAIEHTKRGLMEYRKEGATQ